MRFIFDLSFRFWRVWQRNLDVYRESWLVNFLPPLLEPLFYLIAFGLGLSGLVREVHYQGRSVSYIAFITPAMISVNIMYNAFFENTYASFVRMYYQKTFDAMMATPLTLEEIITGEIVWGATKSVLATVLMLAVIAPFGLVNYPAGILIVPLAFLGGIAFGSIGMYFTGIVKNIELFNLPVFLFITPMFLFSGTFFPLDALPPWAKKLAFFLPLTHLVNICRALSFGELTSDLWGDVVYLLVFCLVFFPLAIVRMLRRLWR